VSQFGPFTLDVSTALATLVGAAFGLAADRLAARWPAPAEPADSPRHIDWRTLAVGLTGGATAALLVSRWSTPADLLVLGIYTAALLVLLATDLDQRVLPDLLTLPLIVFGLAVLVAGWSPLVSSKSYGVASAALAGIGAPAFLFITDRLFKGQLGQGDLKLAAGIGLMSGVSLMVGGMLVASLLVSAVLIGLMAVRRIGAKTLIPFGPVLIFGAFAALALGGSGT
jgi:leader peptidase (prepilin peptidase)/N-methyltransferase